jgi:hypothetical protein
LAKKPAMSEKTPIRAQDGEAPSLQCPSSGTPLKHYMVIERFKPGCKGRVYERFHRAGRMIPDGLTYIDSWLERDGDRCFQLMATGDRALFDAWLAHWSDLVEIEVVELGDKPAKGT